MWIRIASLNKNEIILAVNALKRGKVVEINGFPAELFILAVSAELLFHLSVNPGIWDFSQQVEERGDRQDSEEEYLALMSQLEGFLLTSQRL